MSMIREWSVYIAAFNIIIQPVAQYELYFILVEYLVKFYQPISLSNMMQCIQREEITDVR